MLERVRIVLVEPSHPGNIGAAARAMKTMGLSQLVLVSPHRFPSSEATFRAAGADDLLENALLVNTLHEGLVGCDWVIGASVRKRALTRTMYQPRACAEAVMLQPDRQVAIVFGRESSGLTNEELSLCHDQVSIPANPEYSSLNLAAAVQVLVYEMRMAMLAQQNQLHILEVNPTPDKLASIDQVAGFYQHLQDTLIQIGFMDPRQPKRLMERLQMLFNRAQLSEKELNILRGILSAVDHIKTG